jgi:PKD repeat protein
VAYHVDPNTLDVSFTSVTSYNGTIKSHKWDFGDGTSYEGDTPPVHRYPPPASSAATTYRIRYAVANDCGQAYWTKDVTISPCLADVKFSYVFVDDSTIQLNNQTSSASSATYVWDFGDGTTSTSNDNSVTKTYRSDKSFTVSLKATNACGDNYYTATVRICRKAIPSQTLSLAGCGKVSLNASATKNGAKYQWNFGNGVVSPASPSATPTISYTYPTEGSYTITLTVINQGGCDTARVTSPVTISGSSLTPNNNWSYSSDDLDFNFSRAAVTGATRYNWNFGDGTSSSEQNPGNKTFPGPGVYNLSLEASNDCSNYKFSVPVNVPYYRALGTAPNTGFQDVAAISAAQIYFLGANGKLYKADSAGNWSNPISLPGSLDFNSSTRLFRDAKNNLWIYGRGEVAKFNTSSFSWTSYSNAIDLRDNTTVSSIAVDNSGDLWTVARGQLKRNATVISSGNTEFSSLAYAPATGLLWMTSSNRNSLYYVNENSTHVNSVTPGNGVSGGDEIKIHPNGEIYFTIDGGMMRTNGSGNQMNVYNSSNTNGLLGGAPKTYAFDNEGNLWALYSGRLLKIPVNASSNAQNYSFTGDLGNLSSFDILNVTGTDNDIILAKTSGNAAIKIK